MRQMQMNIDYEARDPAVGFKGTKADAGRSMQKCLQVKTYHETKDS